VAARKLTAEEFTRLGAALPASLELPPAGPDTRFLGQLLSIGRSLLNELLAEQSYAAGEIVFEEGERGDSMYLIRSGRVAVVKGDWLSPAVLVYQGPGDIVGEMALLDDKPRSASIVAMEDVRLFRITRQDFRRLLKEEPDMGMRIMETLSSRLRESNQARLSETVAGRQLARQVTALQREKIQLAELHRAHQETSDLIVQDLRNLLSSIYGAIQMLHVVLPEEALSSNREILDIATASCDGMQRLIDSLLDVARLEAGEVALNPAEVKLCHLVEGVVSGPTRSWEAWPVLVHALVPCDLPLVVVDADTMSRTLLNLADNAVRYSPAGGVVLIAAAVEGEQVVVRVTDGGPCPPPEERERIFEQFSLVAAGSPPGSRRGFGLELVFCRLVVEAHGGQVWVEPGGGGEGCCFALSLPLESALLPPA